MLFDKSLDNGINNESLISLVDKSVSKDSDALIAPHSDQLRFFSNLILSADKETFVDTGQITQVENVVELDGSTGQLLRALVEETESGQSDCINWCLTIVWELGQVFTQNC